MADSVNLLLPYIAGSQSQKHVTHNEAIRMLDGLVQMSALDRDLAAPPGGAVDGDRYLVASGATGAWSGWDGSIAYHVDGTWMRLEPRTGWRCWIEDEADLLLYDGAAWQSMASAMGAIALGAATIVSQGPDGSRNSMVVEEELLSGLSGASVDSGIVIPNRAVVFGVSTRTVTAITGATSYDCGIAGETSKFGGSLGVAPGSTNAGVIGPQAFYADTPIRLTANGGNFTAGAARIAIHYLLPRVPQS